MNRIFILIAFLFTSQAALYAAVVAESRKPNLLIILSDDLGKEDAFHPLQRGFTDFFGFLGGSHSLERSHREQRPI